VEAVRLLRSSGRPVPQLARELGCSPQSLRNWSRQIDTDQGRTAGSTSEERDELRRLRREVKVLAEEREILKIAARPSSRPRSGHGERVCVHRCEEGRALHHQIMCRVLDVSRSGFHAWQRRVPCARAVKDARLTGRIREIHRENRKVYGSPRVHAERVLGDGEHLGRKRVERLMRHAGLSGLVARRRGRTTIGVPGVRVCDDLG